MAGGSIPACAGETDGVGIRRNLIGVYPRLCGGNSGYIDPDQGGKGLSPLVRGKLMYSQNLINSCGSIPACAGETRWASRWPTKMRVYPRLCGGNTTIHSQESGFLGLSPLVRGKLLVLRFLMLLVGSIPACAGETRGRRQNVRPARVYPRLCGGNK